MTTDQERTEFEARYAGFDFERHGVGVLAEYYLALTTQTAWEGFQQGWEGSRPQMPELAPRLACGHENWSRLYAAAADLMSCLGVYGAIDINSTESQALDSALYRLDAGVYVPGLAPSARLVSPEPLTADQIQDLAVTHSLELTDGLTEAVRATEAFHGIGTPSEGAATP